MPDYGNTHSSNSITSLQTTLFRNEARFRIIIIFIFKNNLFIYFIFRDIIKNNVNASERDSVIFVGSGCTGAVAKLIHGLNLNESPIGIF